MKADIQNHHIMHISLQVCQFLKQRNISNVVVNEFKKNKVMVSSFFLFFTFV